MSLIAVSLHLRVSLISLFMIVWCLLWCCKALWSCVIQHTVFRVIIFN